MFHQTKGMGFNHEALRPTGHVTVCPNHLDPNLFLQASPQAWRIIQVISLTLQTQIGWWVPIEDTWKFIWSPKELNPSSWASLACTSHDSPWILIMPSGGLKSKVCSYPNPLNHLKTSLASPNPNLSDFGSWWNLWSNKPQFGHPFILGLDSFYNPIIPSFIYY